MAPGDAVASVHDSRPHWTQIIARFERSGMTQAAFAEKHDLKLSTFRSWLYRLRNESQGSASQLAPRFIEVTPSSSSEAVATPLRIRIGAQVQIEFAQLPSPAYLAAMLSALEGGTC
jgi:transposase-like protein